MSDLAGVEGFTPGPWYCEQPWSGFSAVRGPQNELIFGLAAGAKDEKQSDEICEANARLIALAPTMYAELSSASLSLERSEKYARTLAATQASNEAGTIDAMVGGAYRQGAKVAKSIADFIAREALRPALEKTDG